MGIVFVRSTISLKKLRDKILCEIERSNMKKEQNMKSFVGFVKEITEM